MQQSTILPVDMKVLMNHIYEYKKGVRRMVLFTFNKKYEDFAIRRLESQNIKYVIQPVGNDRLNLYFGREECLNAIRMIVTRPLNLLTPEEDFMLGGCGTLAEMSELITWKQLGLYLKPIVILNTDGYYDSLLEFLQQSADAHFMRQQHTAIWRVATTPAQALDLVQDTPLWDTSIRRFAAL